jgi:ABC-type multidrug transport system ATPase subunit
LVGESGSGKTTLSLLVLALHEPTSGTASVNGIDVVKEAGRLRERIALEMKKAGCIRIYFGIESGNDLILKLMNKKITTEQAREAVEAAQLAKKTGNPFRFIHPCRGILLRQFPACRSSKDKVGHR